MTNFDSPHPYLSSKEIRSIPTEYETLIPVQELLKKLDELNERYHLFKKGSHVLDLGCGHGQTANMIASHECTVDGVDLDEDNIRKAREKYPNIHFTSGNAAEFKTDTKYDTIVSQMVICNLKNEATVKQFIANVYQLLRDDGTFFLSNSDVNTNFKNGDVMKHTFEGSPKTGNKIKVQLLTETGGYSEPWTNYVYTEEDLTEWLKESGFEDIVVDNSMRDKGYHFIISKKLSDIKGS